MSKMFCQAMDWWELAVLLEKYIERLNYGVREEVLPLLEIPGVKQFRARSLYNAGIVFVFILFKYQQYYIY